MVKAHLQNRDFEERIEFMRCRASREGEKEVIEGLKVGQRKGRATQPLRLSYATSRRRGFAGER